MNHPTALLVILGVLLVFSAFLSMSETALMALSRIRLRHLVAQGGRRAKMIQGIVTRLDNFISTILLANNFVNIAFSSLATAVCVTLMGQEWGIVFATLGSTIVILVFGEITPKIAAAQYTERIALWVAPLIRVVVWLLSPLAMIFSNISRFLLRLTGIHLTPRSPLITEEEIRLMIEVGKEEGVLGEQERQLLHRIFEFGDTKVGEVMVPREKMTMVSDKASHSEVLDVLVEGGYSRILVYPTDDRSRVIGVIHAHDILNLLRGESLIVMQDIIRPIYTVAPEKRVSDLLLDFQQRRVQIAVVVDPQGKALGMATLEDLVEEIIGDVDERRAHPTA